MRIKQNRDGGRLHCSRELQDRDAFEYASVGIFTPVTATLLPKEGAPRYADGGPAIEPLPDLPEEPYLYLPTDREWGPTPSGIRKIHDFGQYGLPEDEVHVRALLSDNEHQRWNAGTPFSVPTFVTYSFPTDVEDWNHVLTSPPFPQGAQVRPLYGWLKTWFRGVIAELNGASGLQLVEVSANIVADIDIIWGDSAFHATLPYGSGDRMDRGHVAIHTDHVELPYGTEIDGVYNPLVSSGVANVTRGFLHEMLHAAGLIHPTEGSQFSIDVPWNTGPEYTVMWGSGVWSGGIGEWDKEALRFLYGESTDVDGVTRLWIPESLTLTSTGNDFQNYIVGVRSNDVIDAKGGNDVIYGRDGLNEISAGEGDDRVYGGSDVDLIMGEAGNDQLYGNGGDDVLDGGSGNDIVAGNAENDRLIGGSGDDMLYGDRGPQWVSQDDTAGNRDVAVYGGSRWEYTVTRNADQSLTVHDLVAGRDGTDMVHDVEIFEFAGTHFDWQQLV